MMDNRDNFTDKFRLSAEDFSLTPSPGVWTNVEANIRKQKRRRFFIFFLLFGGIAVGGGIAFQFYGHNKNTIDKQISVKSNVTKPLINTRQNDKPDNTPTSEAARVHGSPHMQRIHLNNNTATKLPQHSTQRNSSQNSPMIAHIQGHDEITEKNTKTDTVYNQIPIPVPENKSNDEDIKKSQLFQLELPKPGARSTLSIAKLPIGQRAVAAETFRKDTRQQKMRINIPLISTIFLPQLLMDLTVVMGEKSASRSCLEKS